MGLSLSSERDYEGRIREVLQEDRCSSMYSIYIYAFIVLQDPIFMYCAAISCIQKI
jgi:hypothetical protein